MDYQRLSKLQRISIGGYLGFISSDAYVDESLVRKINAAFLSRCLGMSLKTALNHLKDKEFLSSSSNDEIIDAANTHIVSTLSRINEFVVKSYLETDELSIMEHLCGNSLRRLFTSYDIVLFLIQNGYNFEPKLILRHILESINFVFQAASIEEFEGETIEEFCKKNKISNTNIGKLNQFFHSMNLGYWYGVLSQYSHFDERIQHEMFREDNNDIVSFDKDYIEFNLYILIGILDINLVVAEFAFRNRIKEKEYINSEGELIKDFKPTFSRIAELTKSVKK